MGNNRALLPVLLGLIAWVSCIVKEDRSACPCFLRVDMQGLPSYPATLSIVGAGQFEVDRDSVLLVAVPKSGVELVAVSGASTGADGTVRIPYGFDCPPVYLFSGQVPPGLDTAYIKVQMYKQFCTLDMQFDGPPGWGEPYWGEVRGRVEGLQADGTPLEGPFDCRLDSGNSVRLPRQHPEEELWLDITMPDRLVRSFALGAYLLKAGYDWSAPDLEDITLTVNLSVSEIRFQGSGWSDTVKLDVDI